MVTLLTSAADLDCVGVERRRPNLPVPMGWEKERKGGGIAIIREEIFQTVDAPSNHRYRRGRMYGSDNQRWYGCEGASVIGDQTGRRKYWKSNSILRLRLHVIKSQFGNHIQDSCSRIQYKF